MTSLVPGSRSPDPDPSAVRIPTREDVRAIATAAEAEWRAALQRGQDVTPLSQAQTERVLLYVNLLREAHGAEAAGAFLEMYQQELDAVAERSAQRIAALDAVAHEAPPVPPASAWRLPEPPPPPEQPDTFYTAFWGLLGIVAVVGFLALLFGR